MAALGGRGWEHAPDAGNTALGHYGLTNPLVAWMLRRCPDQLAATPSAIVGDRSILRPPLCPRRAKHPPGHDGHLRYRGDHWACYAHGPDPANVVRVPIDAEYERAPDVDVLGLAVRSPGSILDWQWDPWAGRYAMTVIEEAGAR